MRTRPLLLPLLALLLMLPGCSLVEKVPPVEDTLRLLATGIHDADLSGVPVTGDTQGLADQVPQVFAETELRPRVAFRTTEKLDRGRTTTTAQLDLSWTLREGSDPWTYTTDVSLVRDGETWRVAWSPQTLMPGLERDRRIETSRVRAERADILGRNKAQLVTQREVQRVGIDRSLVAEDKAEASARALAKLLDIDADSYAKAVTGAGKQAFVEGLAIRSSQINTIEKLSRQIRSIKGARMVGQYRPLTPVRGFAEPVLGVAGEATKELIDKAGGDLAVGDWTGVRGLQARYDDQLRGTPGVTVSAVPMDENSSEASTEVHTMPAVNGKPLQLTLDEKAQIAADSILAGEKRVAAMVAIQPSTGQILAVSSSPAAKGYSVATLGQYPPGSTFKVVSLLALLRSGHDIDETVDCSRNVTVNGRVFKNYDDYPSDRIGRISLGSAFANSCNTAIIREASKLDSADLQNAARALGLDTDADLGYPFSLGSVPDAKDSTELAAMTIGQGRITTDALGIATMAASVVKGARVTPNLVLPAKDNSAKVDHPLTDAEAKQLRTALRMVVTEGSGRRLFLGVDGGPVGAKTGTAEYGNDDPPKTHGWMLVTQGDLAVAAFVEGGSSGSGSAGPLLKKFLDRT